MAAGSEVVARRSGAGCWPWSAGVVAGAIVLGCVLATAVAAQGTARSLDIPPGARENALGRAGVALIGDPSDALWWNPAALGFAEWYSAQYTRARLGPSSDLPYKHVAAGIPIGGGLGLGLSGTFLSYGATPSERAWAFATGYRFKPSLAAGLTMKYVRLEGFSPQVNSTVGFDLGGLFRKTLAPVTVGAGVNVQNIGPAMEFPSGASAPLGRNLKIGVAASVQAPSRAGSFEAGATLLVDHNQSLVTDEFRTWSYGAEIHGGIGSWARAAFRLGYYDDPSGQIQDWTYGAGVRVFGASVDVASIPQARTLPRVRKWTFGFHTDVLRPRRDAR
jgi:hypothetical protein